MPMGSRRRPMLTLLLTLAALVAAVYVAGVLTLYALQGRMVFPGDALRVTPAQAGVPDMAEVTVRTADGLDLLGWYRAPADPARPTVLLFHGNAESVSRRAAVARDLLDAGYGVYQAEYRGYGGNPGTPSEAGLYEDARAAMDFLERRGARVVLHGYSLGSGVAVQIATERRVEAMILEAPFASVVEVAARLLPVVPVRRLVRDRFESVAKIGGVRVPLLIYYGTADRVIPIDQFGRLFEAANEPKRLLAFPGADHVDAWPSGGRAATLAFLESLP